MNVCRQSLVWSQWNPRNRVLKRVSHNQVIGAQIQMRRKFWNRVLNSQKSCFGNFPSTQSLFRGFREAVQVVIRQSKYIWFQLRRREYNQCLTFEDDLPSASNQWLASMISGRSLYFAAPTARLYRCNLLSNCTFSMPSVVSWHRMLSSRLFNASNSKSASEVKDNFLNSSS